MRPGTYYQLSESDYGYAVSMADAVRLGNTRQNANGEFEKPEPVTINQIRNHPSHVTVITLWISHNTDTYPANHNLMIFDETFTV
jgi:hypothetical protein